MHVCTHARTHACTHARTHTHTHTRARTQLQEILLFPVWKLIILTLCSYLRQCSWNMISMIMNESIWLWLSETECTQNTISMNESIWLWLSPVSRSILELGQIVWLGLSHLVLYQMWLCWDCPIWAYIRCGCVGTVPFGPTSDVAVWGLSHLVLHQVWLCWDCPIWSYIRCGCVGTVPFGPTSGVAVLGLSHLVLHQVWLCWDCVPFGPTSGVAVLGLSHLVLHQVWLCWDCPIWSYIRCGCVGTVPFGPTSGVAVLGLCPVCSCLYQMWLCLSYGSEQWAGSLLRAVCWGLTAL